MSQKYDLLLAFNTVKMLKIEDDLPPKIVSSGQGNANDGHVL